MSDETKPTQHSERPPILDIGAGDLEAPANAIPNIIAHLVETETWRNAATVVMGALLIGLGYWAYHGVHDAIAETQTRSLDALLGTVARGLDVWIGEHRAVAVRLAGEPDTVARAVRLASGERTCQSSEAHDIARALQGKRAGIDAIALRVVDRAGLVLASTDLAACGKRLRNAAFRQRLDSALDGEPQVVRPYRDAELSVVDAPGPIRPVAWFIAAIPNGNARPTTALALGILADRDLVTVFTAARPGETTEAYAFSDDATMLTPSRFNEELATVAPIGGAVSNAAFVAVRDPGGDLLAGFKPALEPAARPPTRAAALAIAARTKTTDIERQGAIATPYRGYLGTDVIGAWRWVPALDTGIVAEISAAEAYAPLRYLLVSFSVIGGFTVLMLAAALISSLSLWRLQRQFGRLQRLGAYTLERQISEGGMATIYLARHALLKRPTAIKILKKQVATDEFVHRFEREVQLASQLLHPNTVQIYDFGRTREGQPYYVMEYLEGITLAELIAHSGPVPAGRVIHILRQVGAALREAHSRGMVHRDVKPENVMLCRRGEDDVVKLLDFGLVKDIEHAQTRDITKQLKILGTPRYMAPERILNPADVDARADIYAVGAVGYFLITGKPIFEGENNLDISNQVLHAPAPRASASVPGIPEALDGLIAACLEKERSRRPPSIEAFIESLDRLSSRLAWTQSDAAAWWLIFRESRRPASPAPVSTRVS